MCVGGEGRGVVDYFAYTHFEKFPHYSFNECRKACKILHDAKQN